MTATSDKPDLGVLTDTQSKKLVCLRQDKPTKRPFGCFASHYCQPARECWLVQLNRQPKEIKS